jgi:hypothetical protein
MNKAIQKLLSIYKNSEDGLTDVSKLTGLKRYDVIDLLKLKCDPPMANIILTDLLNEGKLPSVSKNCKMNDGGDGVWYLETKFDINDEYYGSLNSMATPFWDGNPQLPVDSAWMGVYSKTDGKKLEEIDSELYDFYDTPKEFEGLQSVLEWYRDFYTPKVNEILKKHFEETLNKSDLFEP